MGASLSRSQREKSEKKAKRNASSNRPKGSAKGVKGKRKDEQHERAEDTGQETSGMERRDSKNFWISHITKRNNSRDTVNAPTAVNNTQTPHSKPPREPSPRGKQQGRQKEIQSGPNKNNNANSSDGATLNHQPSDQEGKNMVLNGSSVSGKENQDIQDLNSTVVPQSPGLLPGQASGSIDASNLISVNELYNYFWDGAIHSSIFDTSYLLVVDARPRAEYERGHIVLARCAASLYNDLQTSPMFGYGYTGGEEVIAKRLSEYTHVIVYGNSVSDTRNDDLPEIKLVRELMNYELVDPLFLASGYDSFKQVWPFMCTTKELTIRHDHKEITVYPSLILENQLYLGRGEQATNGKIVSDLKLTHVINIGSEHASPFTDRIQYLNIKLDDNPSSDLKIYFSKACQFISDALSAGGCILVHCNLGVSRSSTIVISYLMKSRQWTLKVAHDFVRDRRTCIRPNRGFLQQLSDWEQGIFGCKRTDADELWF
ncbi:hypothetical protein OS493_022729 [Desmophyllum pertusum]|uniref:protein-tyrosine-phosphatase n=1 Tax=Desmophyllum pertusum TaxID=174260 RepID=A0A9X0CE64_9CNID|nr:hypothetical protein OS493_022729 [Desmophyllum pertusum]